MTIGIIGLGSFGEFAATLIPASVTVRGFDLGRPNVSAKNVPLVSFEEVIDVDILLLAIPLEAYPDLLPKLVGRLKPETLLIDVCSVKLLPAHYIEKFFPGHPNLLMTHPLFGPQSASESTQGHRLIVTKAIGEMAEQAISYCQEGLGLEVSLLTPDEHDKHMAYVHALTFYVARGLSEMKLQPAPFMTPSYKMVLDMVEFDRTHSQELFRTIEQGNPYAAVVRDELLESLQSVSEDLTNAPFPGKDLLS